MQLDLFVKDVPEVTPDPEERLIFCKDCSTHKPTSEYSMSVTTGKGKQYYNPRCKPCQSARVQATNRIKKTAPLVGTHCDCCGVDFSNVVKKNIHMDHCSEGDVFRGWLCRNCNVGLGCLGDTIAGVEQALAYLRNHYERS